MISYYLLDWYTLLLQWITNRDGKNQAPQKQKKKKVP